MFKLFKRPIWSILLILFIMCASCTKYEVRNTISPEVIIIGDKIGISYMLGPIKVNDTLNGVSGSSISYFNNNKDNIKIDLFIEYNDNNGTDTIFKYYISGVLMSENRNVVKNDILLKNRDSIEGFTLIELSGSTPAEVKEEGQILSTPSVKLPEQKPIEDKGDQQL